MIALSPVIAEADDRLELMGSRHPPEREAVVEIVVTHDDTGSAVRVARRIVGTCVGQVLNRAGLQVDDRRSTPPPKPALAFRYRPDLSI